MMRFFLFLLLALVLSNSYSQNYEIVWENNCTSKWVKNRFEIVIPQFNNARIFNFGNGKYQNPLKEMPKNTIDSIIKNNEFVEVLFVKNNKYFMINLWSRYLFIDVIHLSFTTNDFFRRKLICNIYEATAFVQIVEIKKYNSNLLLQHPK